MIDISHISNLQDFYYLYKRRFEIKDYDSFLLSEKLLFSLVSEANKKENADLEFIDNGDKLTFIIKGSIPINEYGQLVLKK